MPRGFWLRVHGLEQARAAWMAWPATAGSLPLIGPPRAAETLGPGWPSALREVLTPSEAADAGRGDVARIVLAMDCGAAVGFALAVLDDWRARDTEAMRLVIALADSVPAAAREAIAARAGLFGVPVVDATSLQSVDVGPQASPAIAADQARALAAGPTG